MTATTDCGRREGILRGRRSGTGLGASAAEKVDSFTSGLKVLVADEAKEHQLRAIRMVRDLQKWGGGEVPGRQLKTVIDSLHFVSSHASPGVQMADLVAYVLQRQRRGEKHPNAQAALDRMYYAVQARTRT